MAIFKISRPSDCGTYFQSYLQSVLIVANDKAEAEQVLCEWMKEQGESFVKSKYPPEWESWAEISTTKRKTHKETPKCLNSISTT